MKDRAATCDAGQLTFSDGLAVLLNRKLDALDSGDVLEVRFSDPASVHDLRAWLRLTGHELIEVRQEQADLSCRIRRGTARRLIVAKPADGDNRADVAGGCQDTRHLVLDAAARIPVHADPSTGFSPRGSVIEQGAPVFDFEVVDSAAAWSPGAGELYEQAGAGQWNATTDIPWGQLHAIDLEVERAVCQIMTFLAENEFSALYVPAKWIARIHPHFMETVFFLATQVRDEARHIEVFIKRALANGGGLQFSSASTQHSLKSLLDRDDFLEASFLLSVLGEGTFLDLLRFLETHAPESVTQEISRRTRSDEARHVHFALQHIQHAIGADPGVKKRLRKAISDRASALSDVRMLNPLVEESLVILAAGGLAAAGLPYGTEAVRQLHSTMHENRVKRLQLVGFEESEARELSEMHTPNFM
ncbi:MAG TPA: sulfurtransferase TusA family protein [Terriglobia bacterium]|jgi:TusA-related sulfurtransferase